MHGESSFRAGMMAGREPVAIMTRSKLRSTWGGIRFSNPQRRGTLECGAALDVFHVTLFGKLSQAPVSFFTTLLSNCAGARGRSSAQESRFPNSWPAEILQSVWRRATALWKECSRGRDTTPPGFSRVDERNCIPRSAARNAAA